MAIGVSARIDMQSNDNLIIINPCYSNNLIDRYGDDADWSTPSDGYTSRSNQGGMQIYLQTGIWTNKYINRVTFRVTGSKTYYFWVGVVCGSSIEQINCPSKSSSGEWIDLSVDVHIGPILDTPHIMPRTGTNIPLISNTFVYLCAAMQNRQSCSAVIIELGD